MSRGTGSGARAAIVAVVVLLALGIGLAFLLPRAGRGSALSRGPDGWLAARFYLEARGAEVVLLDRPPGEVPPGPGTARAAAGGLDGVLVEVFPWRVAAGGRARALRRHVSRGGSLLLAYSGGFGPAEDAVLEELGLPLRPVRSPPPVGPLEWRAESERIWRLRPESDGGAPLVLPAPRWAPRAPEGATVLHRAPDGKPLVFELRRGGGRVVALPAAALANASLDDGGNADLLEGLLAGLGDRWWFDEHAHGLVAPNPAPGGDRLPRAFDLILVHLAVLYLLVAFTLSRRFGPAWRPRRTATGSVVTYLAGLGRLHDRYGHHRQGARKLVERWRQLHPRLPSPPAAAADSVADGAGLVALGRYLARQVAGGASGILAAEPAAAAAGEEERTP